MIMQTEKKYWQSGLMRHGINSLSFAMKFANFGIIAFYNGRNKKISINFYRLI